MMYKGQKKTDIYLQRLSYVSQIILALLAVFGYFYTVLPLYQKALLDEEIAKKSLELAQAKQEQALLSQGIEKLQNTLRELKDENKSLGEKTREFSEGISLKEKEIKKLDQKLLGSLVKIFVTNAYLAYGVYSLSSDVDKPQRLETPYSFIRKMLSDSRELKHLSKKEEGAVVAHINNYLEHHRSELDIAVDYEQLHYAQSAELSDVEEKYKKLFSDASITQQQKKSLTNKKALEELDIKLAYIKRTGEQRRTVIDRMNKAFEEMLGELGQNWE